MFFFFSMTQNISDSLWIGRSQQKKECLSKLKFKANDETLGIQID